MTKLFSYVVDHDHGYAPNPFEGFCSLAQCKFGYISNGEFRRNIVELAEKGDWIVGTGGVDLKKSAGNGTIIYAMRVADTIPLVEYNRKYKDRVDAHAGKFESKRSALISTHFYYFGRNAIHISESPRGVATCLEKTGPGYRSDFSEAFIAEFAEWLNATYKVGVHGLPCQPHAELKLPVCPIQVKHQKGTK